MYFPTVINWNSPFLFSWMLVGIIHFNSNFNRTFCKKTVETEQMPRSAASGLGLHCLPTSHKNNARLIWVKENITLLKKR